MPFKSKKTNSLLNLKYTNNTLTNVLTPAQASSLPYGLTTNTNTKEMWSKDINGTVTKIKDLPVTGNIVPIVNKAPNDDIDSLCIYHPVNYADEIKNSQGVDFTLDANIDKMADFISVTKQKWVSVHVSPLMLDRIPHAINTVKRFKAKGFKVHLRAHHTGDLRIFVPRLITCDSGDVSASNITTANELTGNPPVMKLVAKKIEVQDGSKNWIVDQWKGFMFYSLGGATQNSAYYIDSNTKDTLTLKSIYGFEITTTNVSVGSGYKISFEVPHNQSFASTTHGYTYYTGELAKKGRLAGADSFSACNELDGFIFKEYGALQGSIFETEAQKIAEQKKLVAHVKSVAPGYPDGYTVSEGFWRVDAWIDSGSYAPLDFFAFNAYQEESNGMYTILRAVDKFGAANVQLDEFSLSGTKGETISRGVAKDPLGYANLINTRLKWCKHLGIRNVFRFELMDTGENGFGYLGFKNDSIYGHDQYTNSILKTIDKKITNWSIGFRDNRAPALVNNSTSLDIGNKITVQFWMQPASTDGNITIFEIPDPNNPGNNMTIPDPYNSNKPLQEYNQRYLISKPGSYEISFAYKKLMVNYTTIKLTPGALPQVNTLQSTIDIPNDRWQHVAFMYDGSVAKLYLDGKPIGNGVGNGKIYNTLSKISIGGLENGNKYENRYDGRIQDIEICKDVLYPWKIVNPVTYETTYINEFIPPITPPNNPSAVLRILASEGTGITLADTSGNNNNATLQSTGINQADWFIGKYDVLVDKNSTKVVGGGLMNVNYDFDFNNGNTTSNNFINLDPSKPAGVLTKYSLKINSGTINVATTVIVKTFTKPSTYTQIASFVIPSGSNSGSNITGSLTGVNLTEGTIVQMELTSFVGTGVDMTATLFLTTT
jgi:Concanavalin A-like lectin/glucanases superfamily